MKNKIITWLFYFNNKSLLRSIEIPEVEVAEKKRFNHVSRLNYNDMAIIIYRSVAIIKATIRIQRRGVSNYTQIPFASK